MTVNTLAVNTNMYTQINERQRSGTHLSGIYVCMYVCGCLCESVVRKGGSEEGEQNPAMNFYL